MALDVAFVTPHHWGMREVSAPKLAKWPFFTADALLLATAWFVYHQSPLPMSVPAMTLAAACLALGAILAVLPFLLEYRGALRLTEANLVDEAISKIKNIEALAGQISSATGLWQTVQESAAKTVASAQAIAERMTGEVKGFSEFMGRVNDREKATMKLEIEKLRRGEADWLQVLVRTLDHIYALHRGAVRSGQTKVIQQIANFQAACRDSARRVGLVPFVPDPSEPFNPERHQPVEGEKPPEVDPRVLETVATGYTYQGTVLRPALVRVGSADQVEMPNQPMSSSVQTASTQEALPLEGGPS
jgi:molecular chaperone GrpE (heat shock protein)